MNNRQTNRSKYWSEMYIDRSEDKRGSNFIISTDPPVKYEDNKKIILSYKIDPCEYDEVCEFYRKYNKMATGNTTLMPRSILEKYLSFDNISILMRSENNNKLMGVIISILVPVRNSKNQNNTTELITHGCTTFLIVHPAIRNHGICMGLIRGLINEGYKKNIYCDYHTVHFKIGDNSISLNCYYRPINLQRSVELGFFYPDCHNIKMNTANRIKYNTKLPKSSSYVKVNQNNIDESLDYYYRTTEDKKFAFYPDKSLWNKWIEGFDTYLISYNEIIIGIVSLNTVHCIITSTNKEGRIAMPMICNGNMNNVLPVLIHIASINNYDVLYFQQYGNLTVNNLNEINCIKTDHTMWFSLYNNKINIESSDISVPLL